MPGFFISNRKVDIDIWENIDEEICFDKVTIDNYYIQRKTLRHFFNDKIFMKMDNLFIITEGVIYNKKELGGVKRVELWNI